jgi:hypothetical protein
VSNHTRLQLAEYPDVVPHVGAGMLAAAPQSTELYSGADGPLAYVDAAGATAAKLAPAAAIASRALKYTASWLLLLPLMESVAKEPPAGAFW